MATTATDQDQAKEEALRLKTIAETKFNNSNIKSAIKHVKKAHRLCPNLDGLSSMLTAFKILRVASKTSDSGTSTAAAPTTTPSPTMATDWYKILQVEPFSHINTIKKQYKKLALILHPDKNPHLGCEEAFKLVGEGFRVLSDKIRRKEYDMRLRIRLQEENIREDSEMETFWTVCSRCRLLHQFDRRYLGHNLVCPSCKMSFEAVEVEGGGNKKEDFDGVSGGVWRERLRKAGSVGLGGKVGDGEGIGDLGSRRKGCSVGLNGKVTSADEEGEMGSGGKMGSVGLRRKEGGGGGKTVDGVARSANLKGNECAIGKWRGVRLRTGGLRRRTSTVSEVLERTKLKRVKFGEEMMTLAEMQLEAKKKARQEKLKLKEKQKPVGEEREKEKETEKHGVFKKKSRDLETEKNKSSKRNRDIEIETKRALKKSRNLEIDRRGASRKSLSLKIQSPRGSESGDLEIMAVDDSDFYDFDKDRVEKSFKKGQVWAIYNDDDGMPRCYGLIDEVVSINAFKVNLSWLDLQSNGDEGLIGREKVGFHISCGRYKVGRKTTINSVNIFSHVVECERAAREIYRIYPKKGSVWALYNEAALGAERRNLSPTDPRSYDIAVFLTTYSELHGLSMAYLEKVDGFKTVFKRREVGCHAIRWLEKDDVHLFSHQIPARKLSGDEVPDLLKDCWELDPASLPSDLLTVGWGR